MARKDLENLLGQKFGKLTVIEFDEEKYKEKKKPYWICRCDCGNKKSVSSANIKQGTVKSCGCLSRQTPVNFRDLTGMKFGEWTVIERADTRGRNTYWLCSCSCGKTIKEVKQGTLIDGTSTKCLHCDATEINIGDKFGTWTVLSYERTNKHRMKLYTCACDCGQTIRTMEYGTLIYSSYPKCDKCRQREIESVHATVLKQIWKYYRPNVVWEDHGCINPNTNKVLDTDIVDHEWKFSVEVQSQYHDKEEQKKRDEIKKNYWESLGYTHYQIDIRDYSVLKMVQIFFPNVTEIPNWVDKSGKITNRKWSYEEAQKWLDEGLNAVQVAEKVGTTKAAINCAITLDKLKRKEQYGTIKNRKTIVQLTKDLQYIKTWYGMNTVHNELGFSTGQITDCCKGKNKTAKGFVWMYLQDYEQLRNNVS